MTTFTVVIQAQKDMRSEKHFPTLEEGEWYARNETVNGDGVEWAEVWAGTDKESWKVSEPLRYYEFGERMNRVTGLPWVDDPNA